MLRRTAISSGTWRLKVAAVFSVSCLIAVACTTTSNPPSAQPETSTSSPPSSPSSKGPTSTGSPQKPEDYVLAVNVVAEDSVDDAQLLAHIEIYSHPTDHDSAPRLLEAIDQVGSWDRIDMLLDGVRPDRMYDVRAFFRRCADSQCSQLDPPAGGCAQAVRPAAAGTTSVSVELGDPTGCQLVSDTADFGLALRSMDLTTALPGQEGCNPPSPVSEDRLAETLGTTSDHITAWGLLWARPPFEVGTEVKMVFRVTGTGEFALSAVHQDGESLEPSWPATGPAQRASNESNYGRPGDEWGVAYIFPTGGCWNIHIDRGADSADFWFLVEMGPG